jgi:hypothetical protein
MIKLLPFLLADLNFSFSFKDSKFRLEKSKETTQRIVLFKELGILNAYTIEASFFGPANHAALENRRLLAGEEPIDAHFEVEHLEAIGRDLCRQFVTFVSPLLFRKKLQYVGKALSQRAASKKALEVSVVSIEHTSEEPQTDELWGGTEDAEADGEPKLNSLLDHMGTKALNVIEELGDFDAQSDSAGSDSCPSDHETQSQDALLRPKSGFGRRLKAAKQDSGCLQRHSALKFRTLVDRRREALSSHGSRKQAIFDNTPVLKQTSLKLNLHEQLSHNKQLSHIKVDPSATKLKPSLAGFYSRKTLNSNLYELPPHDALVRLGNTPGGFRSAVNVKRVRPDIEPGDSLVVSQLGTVKSRPAVLWKCPQAGDDLSLNGTVM